MDMSKGRLVSKEEKSWLVQESRVLCGRVDGKAEKEKVLRVRKLHWK